MEGLTWLGLAAGGLTTASLVPQVRKIWRTKSAGDVSLLMFVAFCAGVSLWLAYGVMKGEAAIIATNAVTLVLGAAIVGMKLKFNNAEGAERASEPEVD